MATRTTLGRLVRPLSRTAPAPAPAPIARLLHSSGRSPSSSTRTRFPSSSCPACGAALPATIAPLCPACSALLPPPPPSTSSFALFNVEPAFDVDLKSLKQTFLRYQQKVHPDLFSGQGERERWAKGWSGRVNDAFRVLEGELSRGEYLLSISDVVIGEGDSVTDPELLMAIMETREELDEATTEDQVAAIRQTNKDNMARVLQQLADAFKANPPDTATAKNLVIHLRYLENVENVCREWAPGKRIEIQH